MILSLVVYCKLDSVIENMEYKAIFFPEIDILHLTFI